MKTTKTLRGFDIVQFQDRLDTPCSIQKSSLANENTIWIGVNDANPMIRSVVGWVPYEVPSEVLFTTRMELTQELAAEILPILQRFVDTGEIV